MTIALSDIWPIANVADYKIHFARWNQHDHPLEVLARDAKAWQGWQEYKAERNEFNRSYIFSLAQFHIETDAWIFGGVFRVIANHGDRYEVELAADRKDFIGRLKLHSGYRSRATRVNFENHYSNLQVLELLPESYSGQPFPGYEGIDVSFDELETLVRNNRLDWKSALENVKGIYLITDISTGRRYVGSASGDHGIWSRWCSYVGSGHGGNIELRALVSEPTLKYCRENFRFALLEHRASRTLDEIILAREGFWKNILLTRGEYGLNRN